MHHPPKASSSRTEHSTNITFRSRTKWECSFFNHSQQGKNSFKDKMDDSGGEIMPVELAVKRELAYRKKVDMLLLQLHDDESRKDQVPSSSSRPSSATKLSGVKRKAPTSFNKLPHQQLQLLHNIYIHKTKTDDLFCKVCRVSCSSTIDFKQHLQGQKHKFTLQNLTTSRNIAKEEGKPRVWCELCKIWCVNLYSFKEHLKGKRHQSKAGGLEPRGKNGAILTNQMK